MSDFNIKEELNKLPDSPGVYIMHDESDTIIYVGKAVNLSNRVRSYFRVSTKKTAKIQKMVSLIDHFEYIITDTELEALVLENNLIKEHSPKYNTLLKDDKTYPYIKVTLNEKYPRVLFTRMVHRDKAKYFGPFTSAEAVKETIDLINKLYGLRTCTLSLPKEIGAHRPCLNYHIKRCTGPCTGEISAEDYQANVKKAIDFLNGGYEQTVKELTEAMMKASEELEFEKAGELKELIGNVKSVAHKQKINDSDLESRDYIAIASNERDVIVQVFFVREGRLIGREHFHMQHTENESHGSILKDFVEQFYSGTPFIPREIFIEEELEETELLEEWLSGKREQRVYIRNPKKGQKEKMLELAKQNAELVLNQDTEKIKREEAKTIGAVREISELLNIPSLDRMEAYDISNTSGFANVASMVVFEKGKPKKSDYRKFKMKTVTGPNDYECMREVLTRRFTHTSRQEESISPYDSFAKLPDLILMDGGRGQVNICLEVLKELGIKIPVCGMVKDDTHSTRGIYYNNIEMPIDTHSEGFHLVTRIQDEAHRFAIEYHRSLRTKEQVHSVLDEIPGVGPSRRRVLMKNFDSIDDLKQASAEKIAEKCGFPLNVAQTIYDYFKVAR